MGTGKAKSGESKGEKKDVPTSRSKFGAVRWFNPAPNNEDKQWLDDNDDELVGMFFALLEAIQPEGRFTSKFDLKSGRWLAVLFVGSNVEGVELDAMSVRGATAIDAAFLLAYFDQIKFPDGWANSVSDDQGRWG